MSHSFKNSNQCDDFQQDDVAEEEEEEDDDEDYDGNSELVEDDNDNEDDDEDTDENHVILDGTLSFSKDGHLIYSGIWYLNHEAPQTDDSDDDDKNGKGDATNSPAKNHFEWISNDCFQNQSTTSLTADNNKDAWMDLNHPLAICRPISSALSSTASSHGSNSPPRKIIFLNGYFEISPAPTDTSDTSTSPSSSKKMVEADLELTLSLPTNKQNVDNNNTNFSELSFHVHGKGKNEYGSFILQGEYIPRRKYCKQYSLICHKFYENSRQKRKFHSDDDDDDDEDDLSVGEEDNAYEELMDLYEDAKLSLQELTQQYSNGQRRTSRRGHVIKRSRQSLDNHEEEEEEEDIDRGCGF